MDPLGFVSFFMASIAAGAITALLGLVGQTVVKLSKRRSDADTQLSYSERLKPLIADLTKASANVDSVLVELSGVVQSRERSIRTLETKLSEMGTREQQLQAKINELESIPLHVADYFAELTVAAEKRSARRDYMLFGAGVVVTTIVSLALRLAGLA